MANPFSGLAGLMNAPATGNRMEICVGEIVGVRPLKVRTGEMELEAEDIILCSHVPQPDTPGGRLLLVSMDENQTYYAIGRC
ncbi:MAG: DUF2577 family protein [Clostridiaceae bacterium]|nr:DUF2577 family protein [Clostridiaceae bacterium]